MGWLQKLSLWKSAFTSSQSKNIVWREDFRNVASDGANVILKGQNVEAGLLHRYTLVLFTVFHGSIFIKL